MRASRASINPLLLGLLRRRLLPRVYEKRRQHKRRAWLKWKTSFRFFKLWLPVRKRRDMAAVLKVILRAYRRAPKLQQMVMMLRARAIRLQRFYRNCTSRVTLFTSLVGLEFSLREDKLMQQERITKERLALRLECHMRACRDLGALKSSSHKLQRVDQTQLMPMTERERRRANRQLKKPVSGYFVPNLYATDEELSYFNQEREKVPLHIRKTVIQEFYKQQKELHRRNVARYHAQLAEYRHRLEERDFELQAKGVIGGRQHFCRTFMYRLQRTTIQTQDRLAKPSEPLMRIVFSKEELIALITIGRQHIVEVLRQKRAEYLEIFPDPNQHAAMMQKFKQRMFANELDGTRVSVHVPKLRNANLLSDELQEAMAIEEAAQAAAAERRRRKRVGKLL